MSDYVPRSLAPHDEYPHPRRADAPPYWCENYWFQAYDPARSVGFMFSLGLTPFDPTLWREFFVVHLPGGEQLVGKQFGRGAFMRGPGAVTQSFLCEEPWRRWVVRCSTPARRVTLAELLKSPLIDGAHEPLRLELSFDGMSPVWDVGAEMHTQAWAHGHYEQACRVRGRLEVGDCVSGRVREAYDIDCTGFRDHSQGPRVARPEMKHTWVHGEFPSGRSFSVLHFEARDDAARMSRAFVSDGKTLEEAVVKGFPPLFSVSTAEQPFRVELATSRSPVSIEGEVLASVPFSVCDGNAEVLLGVARDYAGVVCWESHVRLRWDGEVGYGQLERTAVGVAGH